MPFSQTTGGFVTGSVNYTGRAGFSKTVTIVGGQWSWLEADEHTTHSGPINGGTFTWPVNKNTAISGEGCGHGVAFFNASVFDKTSNTSGTFSGCLNDQLTFPPKIWGDLTLASAP